MGLTNASDNTYRPDSTAVPTDFDHHVWHAHVHELRHCPCCDSVYCIGCGKRWEARPIAMTYTVTGNAEGITIPEMSKAVCNHSAV